jgi:hypothetical protein
VAKYSSDDFLLLPQYYNCSSSAQVLSPQISPLIPLEILHGSHLWICHRRHSLDTDLRPLSSSDLGGPSLRLGPAALKLISSRRGRSPRRLSKVRCDPRVRELAMPPSPHLFPRRACRIPLHSSQIGGRAKEQRFRITAVAIGGDKRAHPAPTNPSPSAASN